MKFYFSRGEESIITFNNKGPYFGKIMTIHLEITQNPQFLEKTTVL